MAPGSVQEYVRSFLLLPKAQDLFRVEVQPDMLTSQVWRKGSAPGHRVWELAVKAAVGFPSLRVEDVAPRGRKHWETRLQLED